MPVLKTTSPAVLFSAPNEKPSKTDLSSRTSFAFFTRCILKKSQSLRLYLKVFVGFRHDQLKAPFTCLRERSPLQQVRAGSRSNLGGFLIIFDYYWVYSVKAAPEASVAFLLF